MQKPLAFIFLNIFNMKYSKLRHQWTQAHVMLVIAFNFFVQNGKTY
jgi:hypothetical protein